MILPSLPVRVALSCPAALSPEERQNTDFGSVLAETGPRTDICPSFAPLPDCAACAGEKPAVEQVSSPTADTVLAPAPGLAALLPAPAPSVAPEPPASLTPEKDAIPDPAAPTAVPLSPAPSPVPSLGPVLALVWTRTADPSPDSPAGKLHPNGPSADRLSGSLPSAPPLLLPEDRPATAPPTGMGDDATPLSRYAPPDEGWQRRAIGNLPPAAQGYAPEAATGRPAIAVAASPPEGRPLRTPAGALPAAGSPGMSGMIPQHPVATARPAPLPPPAERTFLPASSPATDPAPEEQAPPKGATNDAASGNADPTQPLPHLPNRMQAVLTGMTGTPPSGPDHGAGMVLMQDAVIHTALAVQTVSDMAETSGNRSPVTRADLVQTVAADLLRIAANAPDRPLTLTLTPEELGTLHFTMSRMAEGMHIHLTVDQPATLDLLRRHADQFLADLRAAGFADATLGFSGSATGDGARRDPPALPPQHPATAASGPPAGFLSAQPPAPAGVVQGSLNLRL